MADNFFLRRLFLGVFLIFSTLFPMSVLAQSDIASISGARSFNVEVGAPETTQLLRELQQNYPHLENDITALRQQMATMEIGEELVVELQVYNGQINQINWTEVGVGVGLGLIAAVAWQWLGGEALCLIGVAPACACVGPQC